MEGNTRRVVGASLLCFLAALLVFLVYSIATFAPKLVLSAFLWQWVWSRTLVLFIEALIPLQCTAIMLYYSLVGPFARRRPAVDSYEPFYRLVNGVLVVLLVFTLFFAALSEGVRPWLYSRESTMLNLTKLAEMFYSDYQTAQHSSQYENAEYYLNLYLKIDPTDRIAQRQLDQAKLDAAKAGIKPRMGVPAPPPHVGPYYNESARGLVAIARSYERKGDYSSARYYATLALGVSPGNAEAQQLSNESLHALARITPTAAEREQKYYFDLKAKGRNDLANGKVLDAYYLFQDLSIGHPKDPDVVTYLARATGELTQFAFFKDQVDKAAPYPGTKNVLFVNNSSNGDTEILLLKKMVTLQSGTYIDGVEAARFSVSGKVLYHLTAPYGKVIGSSLSMYCVARDKPVSYLPTIVSGSFPNTRHYEIPLSADVAALYQIGSFRELPSQAGMPRLWELTSTLPQFGYANDSLHIEFLRRIMIPFGFLIFSIFSIGFGWSLRVGRKRPRAVVFLFVPLIPYVIYLFETFYLFSGKVLFTFVMTVAGFWPSVIGLIAVQFVLVILALVYLAGRSTE